MINAIFGHRNHSLISPRRHNGRNNLDEYRLSPEQKDRILHSMSFSSFVDDTQENWNNYQKLSRKRSGPWLKNVSNNGMKCPWKLHVYSDNLLDYLLLYSVLSKYVINNDINAKMIAPDSIDLVKEGRQKGKAFTLYPKSENDFKKIASDIDEIVKMNHFEKKDAIIMGDNTLGTTNRLFYRYEYNSGELKDTILNLKSVDDYLAYRAYYERARVYSYLANDMSISDDPFIGFLR